MIGITKSITIKKKEELRKLQLIKNKFLREDLTKKWIIWYNLKLHDLLVSKKENLFLLRNNRIKNQYSRLKKIYQIPYKSEEVMNLYDFWLNHYVLGSELDKKKFDKVINSRKYFTVNSETNYFKSKVFIIFTKRLKNKILELKKCVIRLKKNRKKTPQNTVDIRNKTLYLYLKFKKFLNFYLQSKYLNTLLNLSVNKDKLNNLRLNKYVKYLFYNSAMKKQRYNFGNFYIRSVGLNFFNKNFYKKLKRKRSKYFLYKQKKYVRLRYFFLKNKNIRQKFFFNKYSFRARKKYIKKHFFNKRYRKYRLSFIKNFFFKKFYLKKWSKKFKKKKIKHFKQKKKHKLFKNKFSTVWKKAKSCSHKKLKNYLKLSLNKNFKYNFFKRSLPLLKYIFNSSKIKKFTSKDLIYKKKLYSAFGSSILRSIKISNIFSKSSLQNTLRFKLNPVEFLQAYKMKVPLNYLYNKETKKFLFLPKTIWLKKITKKIKKKIFKKQKRIRLKKKQLAIKKILKKKPKKSIKFYEVKKKFKLKYDFFYKSNLYSRYFNSFIKSGKKQKAEIYFLKIIKKLKKKIQHYFYIFYEEVFLKKCAVYLKLIRRGKILYRVPYQSLKHRIPVNSTKVIKKNKNIIKTRTQKIMWDKENLINLIYKNRVYYHYRW